MKLICQHCDNEWDYQGNNHFYGTCSKCHNLVSIKKHKGKLRVPKTEKDVKPEINEWVEDEQTKKADEFLIKNKDIDITKLKPKVEQKQEQPKETVEQPKNNNLILIDEMGMCSYCGQNEHLIAQKYGMKMCGVCVNNLMENGLL